MAFQPLVKTTGFEVGRIAPAQAGGKRVLVCRIADGFYVIDDTCTHDDGPLAGGCLDGDEIECPRHGARFDVKTGEVRCLPAAVGIRSYPVKVENETVYADLSP